MKKILALALCLFALPAHAQFSAQVEASRGRLKSFPTASLPAACFPGWVVYDSTTQTPKICANDASTWVNIVTGSGAGANTALSNLAAVSINAALIPQTTLDLGAQATPWKDVWLYGSGTYGSHSFRLTGTPTDHRVVTFPNVSFTVAGIDATQNISGAWTFISGTPVVSANADMVYQDDAVALYGTSTRGGWEKSTIQTPDTFVGYAPSDGNTFLFMERGDSAYDYAVAQQTNPTLVVASANQSANERVGLRHNQTQPQVVDLANTAANARPVGVMGGSAVASAATITPTGNVFHITGTTNIDTLTIMASGTIVTFIFDGVLTVGDLSGNINLSAAFVTTANDTLTLMSDGTTWFEIGRSVN